MRKYQQRQILELLRTIEEAQSNGLYAACQESAVSIGEFIESIEGEGTETVALLEEYCDLLFKANNGEISKKQLRKQFIKIENQVRSELAPNRIEVVFFPYQLSMWDSLESIYLAAANDPACDAFVVPLPFYDLMPDKSFGQEHYDGNRYPAGIPVVDWRTYDIAQRHPDIVFTHYAYDDSAQNGSVPPGFYAQRLREHCERLVYVPYYVASNETVQEYCGGLPGVVYADFVAVQSEKTRQSYMQHFEKYGKQYGWKGRFGKPKEKFIALGSPKYDKVINSGREDYKLPPEWESLIVKPDGTMKKVILYNTHMFTWINNGLQYFKKLYSVFNEFKGRDDVILWWRPHPNTEVNFRTLRPQWYDEYKRMIDMFIQNGIGIYDDTPDLHRSLVWSDAYYGDWSSLVSMYQLMGKPVMIQDIMITSENAAISELAFENFYDDGEYFWFTAFYFNALFRMDKITWKAEYMGSFPNEKPDGYRLYSSISEYNGKLYFSPLSANGIAEYDIAGRKFRKIAIEEPTANGKFVHSAEFKFYSSVQYNGSIFMVPCYYPAIIRYDTERDKLEYLTDWVKLLNQHITNSDFWFFSDYCVNGSVLTMACANAPAIVTFDMDSYICEIFETEEKTSLFRGICSDGENIWIAELKRSVIFKWNPVSEKFKRLDNFPSEFKGADTNYWNIKYVKGYVYTFPHLANMALKINAENEKISIAEEFQPECGYERNDKSPSVGSYIMSKVVGDKIYAHTGKSNRLIEYDCKTGRRREQEIIISKEDWQEFTDFLRSSLNNRCMTAYTLNEYIVYENIVNSLYLFSLELPGCDGAQADEALNEKRIKLCRDKIINGDGTAGRKIYEYALSKLNKQ